MVEVEKAAVGWAVGRAVKGGVECEWDEQDLVEEGKEEITERERVTGRRASRENMGWREIGE